MSPTSTTTKRTTRARKTTSVAEPIITDTISSMQTVQLKDVAVKVIESSGNKTSVVATEA